MPKCTLISVITSSFAGEPENPIPCIPQPARGTGQAKPQGWGQGPENEVWARSGRSCQFCGTELLFSFGMSL